MGCGLSSQLTLDERKVLMKMERFENKKSVQIPLDQITRYLCWVFYREHFYDIEKYAKARVPAYLLRADRSREYIYWLRFLEKRPHMFPCVPSSIVTAEFCLEYLSKNGYQYCSFMLNFIDSEDVMIGLIRDRGVYFTKSIPKKFLTQDFYLKMIRNNIGLDAIQYFPADAIDDKNLWYATVEKYPYLITFMPPKWDKRELWCRAAEKNIDCATIYNREDIDVGSVRRQRRMPDKYYTEKIWFSAIQRKPELADIISVKWDTREYWAAKLRKSQMNIMFMPTKWYTEEIWHRAVYKYPYLISADTSKLWADQPYCRYNSWSVHVRFMPEEYYTTEIWHYVIRALDAPISYLPRRFVIPVWLLHELMERIYRRPKLEDLIDRNDHSWIFIDRCIVSTDDFQVLYHL